MHTVVKDMLQPTLFDFNDWLQRKAEAHARIKVSGVSKTKVEKKTKSKVTVSLFPSHHQLPGPLYSLLPGMRERPTRDIYFLRCPCCKGHYPLW